MSDFRSAEADACGVAAAPAQAPDGEAMTPAMKLSAQLLGVFGFVAAVLVGLWLLGVFFGSPKIYDPNKIESACKQQFANDPDSASSCMLQMLQHNQQILDQMKMNDAKKAAASP